MTCRYAGVANGGRWFSFVLALAGLLAAAPALGAQRPILGRELLSRLGVRLEQATASDPRVGTAVVVVVSDPALLSRFGLKNLSPGQRIGIRRVSADVIAVGPSELPRAEARDRAAARQQQKDAREGAEQAGEQAKPGSNATPGRVTDGARKSVYLKVTPQGGGIPVDPDL